MEEEYYIEESGTRTKVKIILIILFIIAGSVYFLYYSSKHTLRLKTITYEVGSKINYDPEYYIKSEYVNIDDYRLNVNNVPVSNGIILETGEYEYQVSFKKVTKTGKIKVIDTTAPTVKVTDLTITTEEEYIPDDFLLICDDFSKPCNVEFEKESSANLGKKQGNYKFNIIISDKFNNKVTKEVNLNVTTVSNNVKKNDLKAVVTDPVYNDFNGNMILIYDKAIEPNEVVKDDLHGELLSILEKDLHEYLDPMYINNLITDTKSMRVLNQYGYVVGYAIRVVLDNGEVFYLK